MPAKIMIEYEVHQDQLLSMSRTVDHGRPSGSSGPIGRAKIPSIPFLMILFALAATGQTFSSGSTGADGALDLTSGEGDRFVQLPDSGILNYTTVNIPAGRTLRFRNNLRNTPVVMLVQGNVAISGEINVSASGLTPGPGGFYGGGPGQVGFGPGAGQPASAGAPVSQHDGIWIGPLSLVPNIGGAGGGGTSGCGGNAYGGSGGGAITIASSTSIILSGAISAGGSLGSGVAGNACGAPGSNGGQGAIRLVANSINVSGTLAAAIARLEAPLNTLSYSYSGAGVAPVRSTINPAIVPVNLPTLNIVSIGGYPVPSYSGSSFTTIDVLLPTQLQDPIPVVIQATNVPLGSPVSIAFSGSNGATSTTATLSGTSASSTATVYISGVSRSGGTVTFLFASTTFNANLISSNIKANDSTGLSTIELVAAPGGKTKYRFLRRDGTELSTVSLPDDVRRTFGL